MKQPSSNLFEMQTLLEPYIDFDFIDQLAEPRRKRDGRYYATYLGVLKPEYTSLTPDMRTLVIKEIMPTQAENYRRISSIWNPYLETVYGVLPGDNFFISFNEIIRKPSTLSYYNAVLYEKSSLSLEDYICHFGCLSEQEALIFMVQLCEGLEALKKLHIVHGDISPQNILLTDRFPMLSCPYPKIKGLHHTVSVKIIDYDIAREQKGFEHLVTTVEGTRLYAAPEILDYQSPTDRVDIYSLGCILSYMLTGKSPKEINPSLLRKTCSPRAGRIIRKCTLDYSHRYRNVTLLKKELQTVIDIRWPRNFLRRIPGFRTLCLGHMCIATYCYYYFIMNLVFELTDLNAWISMLAVCLMPILGFDLLRLGNLFYPYSSYRDRHPWIRIVVRIIIGLLLPFSYFIFEGR
ncbi:MAG: protein kinase [Lachnospiraceae bacterium]|nr:protein kinase [Lachnospiraceae bacterium]